MTPVIGSKFDLNGILSLQTLLWPLLRAFGAPDVPSEYIAPTADTIDEVANVTAALTDLLRLAAAGLRDGVVTRDEIDAAVAQANTVWEAIEAVRLHYQRKGAGLPALELHKD